MQSPKNDVVFGNVGSMGANRTGRLKDEYIVTASLAVNNA